MTIQTLSYDAYYAMIAGPHSPLPATPRDGVCEFCDGGGAPTPSVECYCGSADPRQSYQESLVS